MLETNRFRPAVLPPVEMAVESPADALLRMAAGAHEAGGFGSDRASVIAATPTAPILLEILEEADALRAIGAPRIVLSRAGRSSVAMKRLLEIAPQSCVRVADFPGARALSETAVIGVLAQWTGRPLAWRPQLVEEGRFTRFGDSDVGKRRAGLAHAQFDRAWQAAAPL